MKFISKETSCKRLICFGKILNHYG